MVSDRVVAYRVSTPQTDHLIRISAHAPLRPMVANTGVGTRRPFITQSFPSSQSSLYWSVGEYRQRGIQALWTDDITDDTSMSTELVTASMRACRCSLLCTKEECNTSF
ncbi:hypothetical protein TNCV_4144711 [Trichonephila clavipes]|nr:hypothetical protein TNCV_4144711 [Trichonephila clavipes]